MLSRMNWDLTAVSAIAVGLGLVLCVALVSCAYLVAGRVVGTGLPPGFVSNGQLIYFRGLNDRGERIPFEGGAMWLYRQGGSCVSCHGTDGHGGNPVMMGTELPGDIRYHHLTEEGHEEGEEHPPYTDEAIRCAITLGLDPADQPLDPTMPRWQISDQDLDDLIEFLKTLDGEH